MSTPAAYLSVIVLWSTTPLAINWSLPGGGFAFSLFARMVVGLVCALGVLHFTGAGFPLRRGVWPAYLIGGLSLFGTMLCTYWGAQFIHSGLISVLFGLSPLVTSVMAAVWLGEQALTPLRLAGMALAVVGLAVVFGHGADLGGPDAPIGLAAVLLAVLINAAGLVGVKRVGGNTPPLALTAGVMLVSLPLFGLAWLATGAAVPASLPLRSLAAIVYLGVFGSVLGFALYYYLMKRLSAASLALTLVITPMFALLLGGLFNNETLPPQAWLGAAAICLGLLIHQRGDAWRAASP
ncbi:DMT family transporter [Zoogloea sp.]|uniref:DMT family transporter n=1 Tax=Zoogloea sp. TaxID=49181 RepID=UPI002616B3A3|nr:DMT family transporter [Zoogloea sp.]MDD3353821.1 DMT family transporter [Zoogloea sp.]